MKIYDVHIDVCAFFREAENKEEAKKTIEKMVLDNFEGVTSDDYTIYVIDPDESVKLSDEFKKV